MLNILIVGAGPAGLVAAVELARHGIIPTVVDKRSTPSGLSRAVIIHQSVLDALDHNVAGVLRAEAKKINEITVFSGAKVLGRMLLGNVRNPEGCLYGLTQDRFEHHLLERLKALGGEVRFDTELEALSQDDAQVHVRLNGTPEAFDYVLACDGAQSVIRNTIGLSFDGFDLPEKWSVADITVKNWADPDAAKVFKLPDGQVAIAVPTGNDRYRITSNTVDAPSMLPIAADIEDIDNVGQFNVAIRQTNRYSLGRVFLAGDAAHCHSPVDGRGLNLGVADAVDLAARICNNELAGYHDARHKAGRYVMTLSEVARRAATCRRLSKRITVFMMVKLIHHIGPLNRLISRLAIQNTRVR